MMRPGRPLIGSHSPRARGADRQTPDSTPAPPETREHRKGSVSMSVFALRRVSRTNINSTHTKGSATVAVKQRAEAGIGVAEKLHTIDEVAALLHQQPSTIKAWIRDGKLQGIPIGKGWFVLDSDLQTFFEQQRNDAGAELARRKEKAQRAAKTREANRAEKG